MSEMFFFSFFFFDNYFGKISKQTWLAQLNARVYLQKN